MHIHRHSQSRTHAKTGTYIYTHRSALHIKIQNDTILTFNYFKLSEIIQNPSTTITSSHATILRLTTYVFKPCVLDSNSHTLTIDTFISQLVYLTRRQGEIFNIGVFSCPRVRHKIACGNYEQNITSKFF